ncbi:hypothetical protein LCGC14_3044260 [marine sediment metagenome]|uniref:Uncharacterized protein n=1 Tax=marine sediment metagenome TaxID=412755 RepID=A0A0F8WNM0_9ZZZZ
MNNIILYENRKSGPIAWDASTPEKRSRAFLELFKFLDEEWKCYHDLHGDVQLPMRGASSFGQRAEAMPTLWYWKAQDGDAEAAEKLLKSRQAYEYEEWEELTVRD